MLGCAERSRVATIIKKVVATLRGSITIVRAMPIWLFGTVCRSGVSARSANFTVKLKVTHVADAVREISFVTIGDFRPSRNTVKVRAGVAVCRRSIAVQLAPASIWAGGRMAFAGRSNGTATGTWVISSIVGPNALLSPTPEGHSRVDVDGRSIKRATTMPTAISSVFAPARVKGPTSLQTSFVTFRDFVIQAVMQAIAPRDV